MNFYKYSLGVDVSKDTLDCCISQQKKGSIKIVSTKKFANSLTGFKKILSWLAVKSKQENALHVVLEATGVYHENFAHFINDNSQYRITILLPIKAKFWFKSLNIKTKTDKVDSIVLSRYGLERKSENWQPISKNIRPIKQLSRAYRDLKKTLNVLKNQLHAKEHAYKTEPLIIKLLKKRIRDAEHQCSLLEVELKELAYSDDFLMEKIEKLITIPGVGVMTVLTVVGETNGFELIENSRQLCSYAGMDVIHKDSGKKKGRSRMSKKGNKYIRQAMYMPALSGSKYMDEISIFYQRINERNKSKKIGLLAVARKMLVLIYTLWRKDESYKVDYMKKTSGYHEEEVPSSSSTRRVERMSREEKVVEALTHPTTQNEHLYDQSSEVLLRHGKVKN